jgi:glycosyltransferase involved in cell wall biosynthesis
MIVEIVGKFYDNHSLAIVNRNIVLNLLDREDLEVVITPLDSYDPVHNLTKDDVKKLKQLESKEVDHVDVQVRHGYPPVWKWPTSEKTKIVYIQPWEYTKAPFEWQYKFETFADALIVPSNFCAEVFKAGGINPDNCFVVPNGFDKNVFNKEGNKSKKYGIDSDRVNFVYVGNSQWRKGLDILLNAWSKAFKKYDKATLIIKDNPAVYGRNNVLSEIIKMEYRTGCAEVIYIDDALSNEEMADIYRSSKFVVHPYRAEGFGMHIQEAMACGAFPLVSDKGPTDEFVPDNAGIKFQTKQIAINISDHNVFAMKPGDAMTQMSTHTFANEPIAQSVFDVLRYVYHSHDKNKFVEAMNSVELPNDWTTVSDAYAEVFKNVATRSKVNRYRN